MGRTPAPINGVRKPSRNSLYTKRVSSQTLSQTRLATMTRTAAVTPAA
jgi:hypothetical protein